MLRMLIAEFANWADDIKTPMVHEGECGLCERDLAKFPGHMTERGPRCRRCMREADVGDRKRKALEKGKRARVAFEEFRAEGERIRLARFRRRQEGLERP
jgi:hypothetical protein